MTKNYYINHLREGSINLGDTVTHVVNGTYQDAVNAAHKIWRSMKSKSLVTVHSDEFCLCWWHWISRSGETKDRNFNSGVQFQQEGGLA